MNEKRAREILQALVQGVNPFTGEELPPGSVLQHADVLRAMLSGIEGIKELEARTQRRAQMPKNIGRNWSDEEQKQLIEAFHAGDSVATMAERHARTVRGIESRLEKLGLITAAQRETKDRFGASEKD